MSPFHIPQYFLRAMSSVFFSPAQFLPSNQSTDRPLSTASQRDVNCLTAMILEINRFDIFLSPRFPLLFFPFSLFFFLRSSSIPVESAKEKRDAKGNSSRYKQGRGSKERKKRRKKGIIGNAVINLKNSRQRLTENYAKRDNDY